MILQDRQRVGKIVDDMTLFDDDLMSQVFDGNIPATKLILSIILKRDDIEVISVVGQKELNNPIAEGRNIKLDILIKDKADKYYDIEVQRSNKGAIEKRARFYSSMMDSRMLLEGQNFGELRESYVIFITEKDYLGYGLPSYTVKRTIMENGKEFGDGSNIVYVNGSYRGDDPIGHLMHDFSCESADDFYYRELAKDVKHFKEMGGRDNMCDAVEKYAQDVAKEYAKEVAKDVAKETAIKITIENFIDFGKSKEEIISHLRQKFDLSPEEAEKAFTEYTQE